MARKREKQTITKGDVATVTAADIVGDERERRKNIVSGTASVAGRGFHGGKKNEFARRIEAAMAGAVQVCFDKGIKDPVVIKKAQLLARDAVLEGKI